ncbi:JAB domain-containing protein [Brevundimonas sp. NPDC046655]|uniref:JAB domain-containing protein n=1 Tax=unclassified Brevundimonas TaxID=2622653 RepID=UPI00384E4F9F
MSSRPASNIREFAPAPASTVEDGDLDLLAAILSRTQSPAASRAAAADLIADFGGLADVAAADEAALLRAGLATAAVADLLRIRALAVAMARAEACHRPVLSSWTALTTYLRADMAHAPREQFRVLYLDRRNILMKDEGRADGTVDHAPVYAAAGGRTETDLFGERPPVLLDPDRLTQAWMKRTGEVAALLESEGLTVHLSAGPSPDLAEDLERLGYAYGGALSEASATLYREARERAQAAADVLEAEGVGDDVVARLEPLIRARIAQDQAGSGERVATVVVLRPSLRIGVEVECYGPAEAEPDDDAGFEADDEAAPEIWRRSQPAYAPPRAEAPEPETEGVTHALHAVRTDVATRGLIRALADAPDVALTALTARLFSVLAVRPSIGRSETALTVTASVFSPTGGRVIEALDGAVRERLDDRRRAWEASGQALVAWVHGLAADDRLGLLAELTALSLDLREERTTLVRGSARAEAAELAALCEADVTRVWTPDAPFLQSHSKDQLLGMLAAMGASSEEVGRLKKTELVAWTADQAAERNWAPACLSWTAPPEDDAATEGAEPSGEADGPKAEPGSEGGEATACDEACDGADVEIGDDTGNETGGETGNEPGRDDDPDLGGLDGVGVFVVTPAGEAVLRNQAV